MLVDMKEAVNYMSLCFTEPELKTLKCKLGYPSPPGHFLFT